MSSLFAMDQSEKVGLGAALGGHAFLLALLVFGLFKAAAPMGADGGGSGDGIAVEIVSEGAAAAPDPAPSVVEEVEETPVPVDETVVDPEPIMQPLPKLQPKPDQLVKPKIKPQAKPVQKQTKTGTGGGGGKSDFEKEMEKKLGGLGGGNGPDKVKGKGEGGGKGPSKEVVAQIRSKTSATIGAEVRPFIPGCAPSTSDNSSLLVFVQLNIGPSANLLSASVYDVQGVTSSNQAQVPAMKRCVLDSLRAASSYNLDLTQFETWRNHKVKLKVNFK